MVCCTDGFSKDNFRVIQLNNLVEKHQAKCYNVKILKVYASIGFLITIRGDDYGENCCSATVQK